MNRAKEAEKAFHPGRGTWDAFALLHRSCFSWNLERFFLFGTLLFSRGTWDASALLDRSCFSWNLERLCLFGTH